jgi:hypothetical protein
MDNMKHNDALSSSGKVAESEEAFFPIATTGSVDYKPLGVMPRKVSWHVPGGIARLVVATGLSVALLIPLAACEGFDSNCTVSASTPTVVTSGSTTGQSGVGSTACGSGGSSVG